MPNPRKPLALARATGAYAKNPQRYRGRNEPLVSDPLGEAPDWLDGHAATAWEDFQHRLPWLNRSHRCVVEIASILQGRMARGELGVPGMNLLRITLGQLGATPADFAKVRWEEADDNEDDLADRYFR